jgi:aminopeptidase N
MYLRLLLALLILATATARADAPRFDVTSYDVEITPDFDRKSISGTERIRFTSLADGLDRIDFSANTLTVYASINGDSMVRQEIVDDRRVFHLPATLAKGDKATLLATFRGMAPKGLVFDGRTVSANYFTCDYMICDQDRTADRAHLSLDLTLARDMVAIAPGRLQRTTPAASGLKTMHWRTTQPRSAYLFGFAAGDFQRITLPGHKPTLDVLTIAAPTAQVQDMFADTRRMLEFFEHKAGIPFPGNTYTQVLVSGSEAQEAASHAVIGLPEIEPILKDPHEDWVIAHELAHQWWGNAITCADWSELWLNERLAVFMVAAYKEQRWGKADHARELEMANKRWQAARDQGFDVPLSWKGKYPSLRMKRALADARSVVLLDTPRSSLGEDAFWRALQRCTHVKFRRQEARRRKPVCQASPSRNASTATMPQRIAMPQLMAIGT